MALYVYLDDECMFLCLNSYQVFQQIIKCLNVNSKDCRQVNQKARQTQDATFVIRDLSERTSTERNMESLEILVKAACYFNIKNSLRKSQRATDPPFTSSCKSWVPMNPGNQWDHLNKTINREMSVNCQACIFFKV